MCAGCTDSLVSTLVRWMRPPSKHTLGVGVVLCLLDRSSQSLLGLVGEIHARSHGGRVKS